MSRPITTKMSPALAAAAEPGPDDRKRIHQRHFDEGMRDVLSRAAERLAAYTLELQRHGLDACEREVRWLEELIANERKGTTPQPPSADPERSS